MDVHRENMRALADGLIGLCLMALAGLGASLDRSLGVVDVVCAIALGYLAGVFVSEVQHGR